MSLGGHVGKFFSISAFDRAHVAGSFLPFRAFMDLFGFVYGIVLRDVYGPKVVSLPVDFVSEFYFGSYRSIHE